MKFSKLFTQSLRNPYDGQTFDSAKSEIREMDGRVVFLQENVKVPKDWSQVATDILAQKYFRRTGVPDSVTGKPGGESDARQVFHRLAGCWTDWGKRFGYFDSETDSKNFYEEVCFMLSNQMAAPNSPQWFNTGLHYAYGIKGSSQGHYYVDPKTEKLTESTNAYEHPQPHACFIQSVADDLVNENGIMDLWIREARLFKYGSGTGTNFSNLRGEGEKLAGGGRSSGLMSFLKIGDKAAGAIKSGGTTRRAAKMVCLDLDHPEIEDFVDWKMREEQKVSALVTGSKIHRKKLEAVLEACFSMKEQIEIDPKKNPKLKNALLAARAADIPDSYIARTLQQAAQGFRELNFPEFDVDWQNEAYETVSGQNSNNSVRVPNSFFEAVERGETWALKNRTDGKTFKEISATDLWDKIAYAAWASADPGVQCDTTINEWHTCANDGRINASNPCSEYMFLDDTACNLASLNLLKFYNEDTGEFQIEEYRHAVRVWTVVLEISVLMAQFPSRSIAEKSYDYRTLGLGYANLGALLMSMGIPYGSPKALAITGALTSILTGESYATSAEMAKALGPFRRFKANRDCMLRVIRNHRRAAYGSSKGDYEELSILPMPINPEFCPEDLLEVARECWDRALALGEEYGFRNAQVSVIAPTGTIGLLMDCDTTGIEPDFSLVKFKKLAGGGFFKIINQSVPRALKTLGYSKEQVADIIHYCVGHMTLAGAPHVTEDMLKQRAKIEKGLPTAFDITTAMEPELLEGLTVQQIEELGRYVFGTMTVEGAPHLKEEHLPVFDCANRCGVLGTRFLSYETHIDMMAAAQPFISGAISKTINMPNGATIDEIESAYYGAWRKMVKAISIYRDGSKLSQPLNSVAVASFFQDLKEEEILKVSVGELAERAARRVVRRELPKRRFGYTVKATIAGQRIYLRTGEYDDGELGEIFIDVYKEGAAYRSLMNAFAISVSLGLQYGVPLEDFVNKFHMFRFEPNGHVLDHDNVKFCSSIVDFIFRDLAMNYLGRHDLVHVPPKEEKPELRMTQTTSLQVDASGGVSEVTQTTMAMGGATDILLTEEEYDNDLALKSRLARTKGYEGDPCGECGQFTLVRGGTCMRCVSCGTTSGCS